MDRGAWLHTVLRVTKSWTQLKWLSMHAPFLVYLIELLAIFWNQIHKSPPSESLPSSSSVEGFPFSSVQSLYLARIPTLHLHTALNLAVDIVTCTTKGSSMLSLCRICVCSAHLRQSAVFAIWKKWKEVKLRKSRAQTWNQDFLFLIPFPLSASSKVTRT